MCSVCKNVLLLGPAHKLCIQTLSTMRNTCSINLFTRFVVLIWRDTDKMPLKRSETADGRVMGRGEWLPASRRRTYVAPSVWWVNLSGVFKKLRNTGSKPNFDSTYWYRHHHHLSTERLVCLLRGFAGSDIMKPKVS